MSLTVQLVTDTATPAVRRLAATLRSPESHEIIGRAGRNVTKRYMEALGRLRHRPTSRFDFYGRAARKTNYRVIANGAVVAIAHEGIAQRYYGGWLRPSGRPSKATGRPITRIAIPRKGSEAEGKTPAEFTDLFVVSKKTGFGGAKAGGFLARKEGRRIRILFWLRRAVYQKPDSSVLPSESDLWDGFGVPGIRQELSSFVDRITARNN